MTSGASRPTVDSETLPLGDVLEFLRVIWQVDHALQRTSKQMGAALGVTGPQRLVLRIVGRFPGIPAGQLANVLHLHPSTLTGVLKRLERQGLLRRRPDPNDARRSLLGLTGRGREFDVDSSGTVEAHVARVLGRTAAHKVRATRELLAEIAVALSQSVDSPRPSARLQRKGTAGDRRKRASRAAGHKRRA
jgi:DNA-binding MarR family transcriptional regulator